MLRKVCSILIAAMLLSTSVLSASAVYSYDVPLTPDENAVCLPESNLTADVSSLPEITSETVCTRDANGNITYTVYPLASSQNLVPGGDEIEVVSHLPSMEPIDDSILDPGDEHGRTQVNPADKRIGTIVCEFDTDGDGEPDSGFYGTASLQSYDILISCAHVLWKPEYANSSNGGWASTITFYAGRNGRNTYAAVASYVNVSISVDFMNNSDYHINENGDIETYPDFNHDWSIIQIDQNLGGEYGWLGLHGCGESELGKYIHVIGYPGDKASYTQWRSPGNITGFDNNKMQISAFATHGNSGSPIIFGGYVYGIQTYIRLDDTKAWMYTGGTRMYDILFSIIRSVRNQSVERWENRQ